MNADGLKNKRKPLHDALNRLVTASTSDVGEGQYSQSYGYDPNTGNLASQILRYSHDASKPPCRSTGGNEPISI